MLPESKNCVHAAFKSHRLLSVKWNFRDLMQGSYSVDLLVGTVFQDMEIQYHRGFFGLHTSMIQLWYFRKTISGKIDMRYNATSKIISVARLFSEAKKVIKVIKEENLKNIRNQSAEMTIRGIYIDGNGAFLPSWQLAPL